MCLKLAAEVVAGLEFKKSGVEGADLGSHCRSHELTSLYVVDSSIFPSSAALNPALTIAANALRVAPTIVSATQAR